MPTYKTHIENIQNSSHKKIQVLPGKALGLNLPAGQSSSLNTSVSPLSRGEDGVGVAVSFPLLLPLLLAVRREGLLQLLFALKEISTRAHDVLLDFAVALHV